MSIFPPLYPYPPKPKSSGPRLSLTSTYLRNSSNCLCLSRIWWFSIQYFHPGLGARPLVRIGRWGRSSFLGISALKPIRNTFWPSRRPYFVVASDLVPCLYHSEKEALLLIHREWRRTYLSQGLGLNCIFEKIRAVLHLPTRPDRGSKVESTCWSKARKIYIRDGLGTKPLYLITLGPCCLGHLQQRKVESPTLRGFLESTTQVKKTDKDQYHSI